MGLSQDWVLDSSSHPRRSRECEASGDVPLKDQLGLGSWKFVVMFCSTTEFPFDGLDMFCKMGGSPRW
jgi:hypothetical protein